MRLDSLTLTNFRCFADLHIGLHPKLTVIVADNGQGKTTILDAARIALWPYLHGFDLANGKSTNADNAIKVDDALLAFINEDDLVRHLPSSIQAVGEVLGVSKWQRARLKDSPYSKTIDNPATKELYAQSTQLQARVRHTEADPVSLPMLGYYGTGRLWDQKKRKKELKKRTQLDSSQIRTYAYLDTMDPASSFKMFQDWFIKIFQAHYAELIKIGQKNKRVAFFDRTKYSDAIEVVSGALEVVLADTDWGHIDFDGFSEGLRLTNKHDSTPLEIRQLSDGLRSVIGLVADMAYRCYQLNKHLGAEAAQKTEGIVLIDEVDMHLHPSWQQKILHQLQTAFPAIQFIITTHSPQVISSIRTESIRMIEKYADGSTKAITPPQEVVGIESQAALLNVFKTSPVAPVEYAKWINDYIAKIEDGTYGDADGLELRHRLLTLYGPTHPVILDADRLIRFQEFKLKKQAERKE